MVGVGSLLLNDESLMGNAGVQDPLGGGKAFANPLLSTWLALGRLLVGGLLTGFWLGGCLFGALAVLLGMFACGTLSPGKSTLPERLENADRPWVPLETSVSIANLDCMLDDPPEACSLVDTSRLYIGRSSGFSE